MFAQPGAIAAVDLALLFFGCSIPIANAQTAPPPPVDATPEETPAVANPAAAAPTLRFWDGSDPALHANGAIDGGSGVWSATAPSWTDSNGATNGPMQPVPAFAVFQGAPGTVTIDDRQGVPAITGMQFLTDGYRLNGGRLELDGGAFTSIRPGAGVTVRIDAELTGAGGFFLNDFGTLILSGANSYAGGTRVDAGTLIGDTRSIRGDLENGGIVVFDQAQDGVFAGSVSGLSSIWGFMVKRGAGTLTLGGSSNLGWRIDEGRLVAEAARFGDNVEIAAAGKLTFSSGSVAGTETPYLYALSGSGGFDVAGAGTLVLKGQSTGFTGQTRVIGTALRVDGALGGTLHVGEGGALSGGGTVGATDIGTGGRLRGGLGSTLHLASLTLGQGSIIDANFGQAGDPALFAVAGNLTLDGTLNVTGSDALGEGIYRLFSYGGRLTDNGLALGALPPGQNAADLSIQTATAGQVNLVSGGSARPLQFWDGGDATRYANGMVDGGPGTWRNGTSSWTGQDGRRNEAARPGAFAVFAGRGGQVLLDGSAGAVATGGLQFAANGYTLSGSGLTLAGGARTTIRVGDGSQWGGTMIAEIAAPLSGNTTLVKRDAGTLILSAANNYTGNTEVEAGTLIGDSRAIRGNIRNAGTLVFDQRTNDSFAGSIAALDGRSGTMVKRGSGALTLTGASTLDWNLDAGRLAVAASRFDGDVAMRPGGELLFEEPGDSRYAGTLSGAGLLIKAGTGNLTLTGNSEGFAGDIRLQFGRLTVDGAIGGALTVEGNTTLAGRGKVLTVRVAPGGTIAPGTGIATLTVAGNLTLAPGSRYQVEVDPSGTASDRIDVLGSATLGGTVAHIGANGSYRPSATYTILTAQRGIQGRFDKVTSSYAFLNPTLGYTSNAVTLTLTRNDVRFDAVAATANQRAAGAALEGLSSGNPLYDAVLTTDAAAARAAFDNVSGAFHASLRTALIDGSSLSRDATLERLRSPADARPGLLVWGQALDSRSHWRGDGNAARLDHATAGALAGIEMQALDGGLRLGMVGGHHRDTLRGQGNAEIDSYHSGLYAGGTIDNFALRAGFVYSWQDVAARRAVAFAGFADGLSARYRASTAQAFGEAAYRFALPAGGLEPFASVAQVRLDVGRGREIGNAAALELERDSMDTRYATVGLRGDTALAWTGGGLKLRASAGWQHAFGDQLPVVAATLDGRRFNVAGLPIAADSLVGELGVTAALAKGFQLDLGYGGALSRSNQDHRARAALSLRF
ncbi:outer membrane autotransporter protein [Sphingomonas naasensis]|uniref:autotransporter domain-containing protein n=1 Tax=Sphingomonas naasensis TaxID=1344951 RepID=UPI001F0F3909|nr:autotransporter domain-containing protein [Sphingomonas naasensis]NIJ20316.1 outer membrane autotransporter protein [Sphingomonas naasensis]